MQKQENMDLLYSLIIKDIGLDNLYEYFNKNNFLKIKMLNPIFYKIKKSTIQNFKKVYMNDFLLSLNTIVNENINSRNNNLEETFSLNFTNILVEEDNETDIHQTEEYDNVFLSKEQIEQNLKNDNEYINKYEIIKRNCLNEVITKLGLLKLYIHFDNLYSLNNNVKPISYYSLKKIKKNENNIKSIILNSIIKNQSIHYEFYKKVINGYNNFAELKASVFDLPKENFNNKLEEKINTYEENLDDNEESILIIFDENYDEDDNFSDYSIKNKIFSEQISNLKKSFEEEVENKEYQNESENILLEKNDEEVNNSISLYSDTELDNQLKIDQDFKKNFITGLKLNNNFKLQFSDNFDEKLNNLKEDFPNFSEVIDYIKDEITITCLGEKKYISFSPFILNGSPGIGKTYFSEKLEEALNIEKLFINIPSVTANFILTGSDDVWQGGKAGIITSHILKNKIANPLIILDEIDKASGSSQHPIPDTLLGLIEKHTAKNFMDEFLKVKCDLSYINWVGTSNNIKNISIPLLSRFTVFNIKSPNLEERITFAKSIFNNILKNKGISNSINIKNVHNDFWKEACSNEDSLRDISRTINKAIVEAYRDNPNKVIIMPKHVKNLEQKNTKRIGFI